jgi:flagellar protein FliS
VTPTNRPPSNPYTTGTSSSAYGRPRAGANRVVDDGVAAMSPARLLVALYERLALDLDKASEALTDPTPTSEQLFEAHERLTHAQRIVEELQLALDPSVWDAADALASIYEYLLGRLVAANLTKDPAAVDECRGLVAPLLEAWQGAEGALRSGPVVELGSPVAVVA